MRAQPAALEHAPALLALLPPELSAALDGLAVRAGRALGPFPAAQRAGTVEPDGYAGIGREVSYERLLLSEWLLADEAPDEFLRRATVGEHSFLSLSRTTPEAQRRCTVLVDAGPGVLGIPRIAMLALLVALERRAQAAGAEFSWRVLRSEAVHHGLGKGDVQAFLEARSGREADADDVAEASRGADELWTLGSARVLAHAHEQSHRVLVQEPWEGGRADLTLSMVSRAPRTLSLPMPEEALCVRLLRDPFAAPPQVARSEAAVSGKVFFGNRGHRLVEMEPARIVAHCVPANRNAQPGRARMFHTPPDHRILGCNYTDRLVVVTVSEGWVHVHGLGEKHAGKPQGGSLSVPFRDALALRPRSVVNECLFLGGPKQFVVAVPLPQGMLLVGRRDEPSASLVNEDFVAGVQSGRAGQALWLRSRGTRMELVAQVPRAADWHVLSRFESQATRAYFAYPRERQDCQMSFVALRGESTVYVASINGAPGQRLEFNQLLAPRGVTSLGIALAANWAEVQLMVLESDKRTITALGRTGARTVLRSEQPVLDAVVCPHAPLISVVTEQDLTLYDTRRGHAIWHARRSEGAP